MTLKKLCSIILCLMLITTALPVGASSNTEQTISPEVEEFQGSEDYYLEYLIDPDEEELAGEIAEAALPTKYDLTNVNGKSYVPALRHQGTSDLCWAFGGMSAVETHLMLKNGGTAKDFSEPHVAYSGASPSKWAFSSKTSYYSTGQEFHIRNYLTRQPLVLEANEPFTDAFNKGATRPTPNMTLIDSRPTEEQVTGYIILPTYGTGTATTAATRLKNVEIVKQHILDYGAVSITLRPSNTGTGEYAGNNYGQGSGNHTVSIVGWDDNYSKANFTTQPPANGAYKIRDNYGSNVWQGGYYWLSYYDNYASNRMWCVESIASKGTYPTIYMHDPLGSTTNVGIQAQGGKVVAANVFDTKAGSEKITAVGFNISNWDSPKVKASVYINNGDNKKVSTILASGEYQYTGYYTLKLPTAFTATGSQFTVGVVYESTSTTFYAPYSNEVTTGAPFVANRSFYSFNGTDFTAQTTDNSKRGNMCVRAYSSGGSSSTPTTITLNSITASTAGPITTGSSVTWTASTSNGSGTKTYTYKLYKDNVLQSTETSSSATYTKALSTAGTYYLACTVSDSTGTSSSKSSATTTVVAPITATISANKTGSQTAGTSVTWTASATGGGTGAKTYKFELYKDNAIQSSKTQTSTTATYTQTLSDAGSYYVKVTVTEGSLTTSANSAAITIIPAQITLTSITADKTDSVIEGESVIWTAVTENGTGTKTYKFELYKDNAIQSSKTQTSATATYTQTLSDVGSYYVICTVTDSSGTANKQSAAITVTEELAPTIEQLGDVVIGKGSKAENIYSKFKTNENAVLSISKGAVDYNTEGTYEITLKSTTPTGKTKEIPVSVEVVISQSYAGDMEMSKATSDWREVTADKNSSNGTPIQVRDDDGNAVIYAKGISAHASSEIEYDLTSLDYTHFRSYIGVDMLVGTSNSSVIFQVYLDGEEVYNSELMRITTPKKFIEIPLGSASTLKLVVDKTSDGNGNDHSNWADAMFVKRTVKAGEKPILNVENTTVAVFKEDSATVTYQVSGTPAPTVEIANASQLPAAITLDTNTKTISIDSSKIDSGTYTVSLKATNENGTASKNITVIIGEVAPVGDAVFKVDGNLAYHTAHGVEEVEPIFIENGRAFVAVREAAQAVGVAAKDVVYDVDDKGIETVELTFKYKDKGVSTGYKVKFTVGSREVVFLSLDGKTTIGTVNIADDTQVMRYSTKNPDKLYLPARVLSKATSLGGSASYVHIEYCANENAETSDGKGDFVCYTKADSESSVTDSNLNSLIDEAVSAFEEPKD